MHMNIPMAAKYPLPQMWPILRKQFFEDSDWFSAKKKKKKKKIQ